MVEILTGGSARLVHDAPDTRSTPELCESASQWRDRLRDPTGMREDTAAPQLLSTLSAAFGSETFQFLELFDYLHDVLVWTKDVDCRFRWVNVPFVLNLGMQKRSQVAGSTDFDLFSPVLASEYRFDDEHVLQGERVVARIELVGRFDHCARWCATTKIPLYNNRGCIVGTAGMTYPLDSKTVMNAQELPLSPAIRFISEHYGQSISNRQLAAVCHLSVRAFERQFRVTYRVSPHDYIRKLRVRMSCNSLVYSSRPLSELAIEFGFADQSHFTKEFRHFIGETPSAYRARYGRSC